MSVVEVHPEELLDRELRGTLSENERQMLSAHLARCSACRMERALRRDFDDALGQPATPIDLRAFVSGALVEVGAARMHEAGSAHGAGEAQPALTLTPPKRGTTRVARRAGWLMAASLLLSAGAGVAFAQLGLIERARVMWSGEASPEAKPRRAHPRGAPGRVRAARVDGPASNPPTGAPPAPKVAAAPHAPRAAVAPHAPKGAVAPHAPKGAVAPHAPKGAAAPPAPKVAVAPHAPKGAVAPHAARVAVAPHAPSAVQREPRPRSMAVAASQSSPPPRAPQLHSAAPSASAKPTPAAQPQPMPPGHEAMESASAPVETLPESAARVFERANTARHRGHLGEAVQFYRALQRQFPDSPEARLSIAVVARIDLDRGKAQTALTGFETYLATRDAALREEALAGRIRALAQLGRAREARAHASEFVARYPRSPFATEAQSLLQER